MSATPHPDRPERRAASSPVVARNYLLPRRKKVAAPVTNGLLHGESLADMQLASDSDLLIGYHSQQREDAFAALVQRYQRMVIGVAHRRTGDFETARDVAQRVFAALAHKAVFLTDRASIAGWLHQATIYEAIRALQSETRSKAKHHDFQEELAVSTAVASTELTGPERWAELEDAIDDLSVQDREAVVLHYFQDLSYTEMSAKLDIPEPTARKRVSRALERLGTRLRERGLGGNASAILAGAAAIQAILTPPEGLAAAALASAATGAGHSAFLTLTAMLSHATIKTAALVVATASVLFVGGKTISPLWDKATRSPRENLVAVQNETAPAGVGQNYRTRSRSLPTEKKTTSRAEEDHFSVGSGQLLQQEQNPSLAALARNSRTSGSGTAGLPASSSRTPGLGVQQTDPRSPAPPPSASSGNPSAPTATGPISPALAGLNSPTKLPVTDSLKPPPAALPGTAPPIPALLPPDSSLPTAGLTASLPLFGDSLTVQAGVGTGLHVATSLPILGSVVEDLGDVTGALLSPVTGTLLPQLETIPAAAAAEATALLSTTLGLLPSEKPLLRNVLEDHFTVLNTLGLAGEPSPALLPETWSAARAPIVSQTVTTIREALPEVPVDTELVTGILGGAPATDSSDSKTGPNTTLDPTNTVTGPLGNLASPILGPSPTSNAPSTGAAKGAPSPTSNTAPTQSASPSTAAPSTNRVGTTVKGAVKTVTSLPGKLLGR